MNFPELLRDAPTRLQVQARAILAAWTQFTHAPLPKALVSFINIDTLPAHQAVRYLPLASALVGLISSLTFLAVNAATGSQGVAVMALIATTLTLTGAFRERGAGHFFDSFSRGETNTQARALGAGGTIAIIILIFTKWQLLASMPGHMIVGTVIAAHAFSSFATMAFLYTHKPLQPAMHGRYTSFSNVRMGDKDFMVMALFGMLPIALLGQPAYIALLPILWIIRALVGVYLTRQPERYTSDALAVTQQFTELGFYLGVLIIVRFITAF